MTAKNIKHLSLFAITWPIFVEQLARILPGTIDTLMVSHLGDLAVAGLAVANQIVVFFVIMFAFIGVGSGVVITHYLGANDQAGARSIASTAVGANFWLGVAVSVLIFTCSSDLLALLHMPPALLPYARPFLALMGGTLFLEALNSVFAAVLRSHGHTRDAMVVTVSMNLLNVVLNLLLIFGNMGFPELGVVGAALSTVISRACACVAFAMLAHYRTGLPLPLTTFVRFSRENLSKILHIGLPAAGENLSWWTSFMVITYFVGQLGEIALATFSYVRQLTMLLLMLSLSIGLGTEIIVGKMVGAGALEAAYRQLLRSLRFALIVTVVATALMTLAAPSVLSMFTNSADVIAAGVVLATIGLVLEPGRTFNLVVINALRATGDARFPVIMGVASMWGLAVPLAWLFGLHLEWGLPGIWLAFTIDEWVRGIAMYLRWKSRAWERHAHASRAGVLAQAT